MVTFGYTADAQPNGQADAGWANVSGRRLANRRSPEETRGSVVAGTQEIGRRSLDPADEGHLKRKYEGIYANSDVWLRWKSQGVHTVIVNQLRDLLPGATVLDVGCGPGRLALMAATFARRVEGIDFAEEAIHMARLNAQSCRLTNAVFSVADFDDFETAEHYDLVLSTGVVEHVDDPLETLGKIRGVLTPGGTAVISCPNFMNFRGQSYMTLRTLFDLPMSLADVRQVSYLDMASWAEQSGLTMTRTVGAIYRWGWTSTAVEDMVERVPLALRDKHFREPADIDTYDAWLRSQVSVNERYLAFLEREGVLRRSEVAVDLEPQRLGDLDDRLWGKMQRYLREDIETEPFYSDVDPFCYQGGVCVYFLRKAS